MARAKTDPTPIDDAASKASSDWLSIVDDVFPQWRDRLESGDDGKGWPSDDGKDSLDALLRDRRTCAAIQYTRSGEITRHIQPADFWRDRLGLGRDADGVDHLSVDYSPYVHDDHSLHGWSRDFVVRRADVERWERLHPELAAPAVPSKEPTADEFAAETVSDKAASGRIDDEIGLGDRADQADDKAKPLEKYKRNTTDDALVAEAIEGLESKKYPNKWQAAQALAPRATGSDPARAFRLNGKIGKALKTPQNIPPQNISKHRKTNKKI